MNRKVFCTAFCCLIAIFFSIADKAFSEEIIVKNCTELMRMAQNLQEDLKTTDIMLGAALDAGSMQNVKTYKLKKETAKQKLEAVLQAINLRGCSKAM